jgi:hypothetical protein
MFCYWTWWRANPTPLILLQYGGECGQTKPSSITKTDTEHNGSIGETAGGGKIAQQDMHRELLEEQRQQTALL